MHEAWAEKLSEYLDGTLDAGSMRAVETHVASCDACRALLAELRQLVTLASELTDEQPSEDLWPGIAQRLSLREASTGAAGVHAAAADVVPFGRRRGGRRVHVPITQLAAAAVVLMALSGGAVWWLGRSPAPDMVAGTILHASGGDRAAGTARLVRDAAESDPAYDRDVAELQTLLAENRSRLDPVTVDVIERSMESIDQAMEDARAALAADPGNPNLHRQLDSTRRKKLDLLRIATRGAS